MKYYKILVFWILTVFLLTACAAPTPQAVSTPTVLTPSSQPATATPTPAKSGGDELPPFMPALKKFGLDKFDASPEEIQLIKMEPVEWPDSCLSAAQAGEICAQVVTPGYKLEVRIKGKVYQLHSDSGQSIRLPAPVSNNPEITPLAEAARLWLMDKLKVDSSAIRVVGVSEENWPDGCLGVHKPDTKCTDAFVPGYRVILEAGGSSYEIRTSRDGKAIILADPFYQLSNPKTPVLEHPQIIWKSVDSTCNVLQAGDDQVAFGGCGAPLKIARLSNPERIKELAAMLPLFHSFTAQTTAGEINFYGGGTGDAAPSQQRAMAEWARIVFSELNSGAAQPDAGLVLTWHREGGIAGFCDNLKVFRSGRVMPSSCKGSSETQLPGRWLTADQLTQLYTWMDALENTTGLQTDNAVADSMKISWSLTAVGKRPASESEKQAIQAFAALVFTTKP